MSLKLYNTLSRKKESFKPIKKGVVGIYGCGPTVYSHQHIGNLFRYVFEDYLIRILKYNNYKVKHVMNVTDVGHLTSDADVGEDKMEKAARKEGKKAKEIADYYLKLFRDDLKKLNIQEPNIWCKATEHIKEQIELIKRLEKKGYTYKTSDGIYFDTSKFKDYEKLAKLNIKGLQAGKRVKVKEKKNKTDFALWKFSEKPGVRQQEWNSPWGIGFPGWHIECSAMSMKYLGETFDIHTGGEDHISVHHPNEIAQSEAATGKKFVNYWLHSRWLLFKGEKMSKSRGGIYILSELEKKEFNPLEYRYLCLTTHYRKQLNFSLDTLKKAQIAYKRLKNIISEISNDKKINEKYLKAFDSAINDDLNMPVALQILWKLVRDEKAKGKINTIKKMDEVFGLDLLKKEKIEISKELGKLIRERETARKNKDWDEADKIREKINKLGYSLKDTKAGTRVEKL
ncbi:cysteine--tRNA ligase [Candidatus Pacearchaeota archaeon]|nr:cysteine--tRNA ligase [Candidatus Pacearchaeota archaeon]